jgi:hypothetical protein
VTENARLRALRSWVQVSPAAARGACRFEFGEPEESFVLAFDGNRWSVDRPDRAADVSVRTSPRALAEFVAEPPARRRLPSPQIQLSGTPDRIADVRGVFGVATTRA